MLSKHQMALYQCLLLGLPICAEANQALRILYARMDSLVTGMVITSSIASGTLGMPSNQAHGVIQNQLAREIRLLSLCIRDNDADTRSRHSHLTTQKRGDIALIGTPASQIQLAVCTILI